MNALEMALEALTNPSTIAVSHAIDLIKEELAKSKMPTKIFGPNLEQILNAAGFYRRVWVGLTDDERNEMRSIVQGHTRIDAPTYGLTLQYATEEVLKEKNNAV